MQQKGAQELLTKYLAGTCTPEEQGLLETWYLQHEGQDIPVISKFEKDKQLDEVWQSLPVHQHKIVPINYWPRIAAVAAIVLCLSVFGYFLLYKPPVSQVAHNQPHDIAPGSNKATLTLANGQKIILIKGLNGKLAQQGNTSVNVNSGNAIAYTANTVNAAHVEIAYNTLATKRGEQSPYPLILADGSKVWLNAASSITFPTVFNGKSRVVTVSGEVYFEVAHNARMPFIVQCQKQTIEVLGTHFNVNAYADEPSVKTTLLEGSVRVQAGPETIIIKPGQQAVLTAEKLQTTTPDTDDIMAWKNGLFSFTNESLQTVMRGISRWYDVDVVYGNEEIKQLSCSGIGTRFGNVSAVLRMMERTKKVHFKIEGKKIIVLSGDGGPGN